MHDWAKPAVTWAVSQGILKGDEKGRLNPQGPVSYTHLDVYKRQDFVNSLASGRQHDNRILMLFPDLLAQLELSLIHI